MSKKNKKPKMIINYTLDLIQYLDTLKSDKNHQKQEKFLDMLKNLLLSLLFIGKFLKAGTTL